MKKLFRSVDRRLAGAAVVSGLLLAPLGIFGSSALAHTASGLGPSAAQYQYKVTVCHRTHSNKHPWHLITISNSALKAHLKHGDVYPPPCPATAAATTKHDHGKPSNVGPTTQTSTSAENHGSSKSHGHDDDHGNNGNNGHHGKS